MAPYTMMIRAAQVYTLADMNDIPGLKALVLAEFTLFAKENWPDAFDAALAIVEVVHKTTPASDKDYETLPSKLALPMLGKFILVTALWRVYGRA